MTVIVGVVYKDGVLLCADSQATLNRGVPLKKLNHTKLVQLTQGVTFPVAIGGAGTVPFITKAIEDIKQQLSQRSTPVTTFNELIQIAESAVLHVTRWFTYDRLKDLQPQPVQKQGGVAQSNPMVQQAVPALDLILLMAGKDQSNEYQLHIVYNEGIGEKQQISSAIGSGAAYAEHTISKLLPPEEVTEKQATRIVLYAINEVAKIDPGVGGTPQLIVIDDKGVKQISKQDIAYTLDELDQLQYHIDNVWHAYLSGKYDAKFEKERQKSAIKK